LQLNTEVLLNFALQLNTIEYGQGKVRYCTKTNIVSVACIKMLTQHISSAPAGGSYPKIKADDLI